MDVKISKELNEEYTKQHKNFNYALSFLLDSVDRVAARNALSLLAVPDHQCSLDISIDDSSIEKIKNWLQLSPDDNVIEKLLVVSLMFPEV